MDILVAGGTGFVGSALCEELKKRDHQVTALARNPPADAPVAVEKADITNYDPLPKIVEGFDAVVNLVSLSPLYHPKGGAKAHESVTVTGTRNLVRAMESTDVDRFIQISALGASPDGPTAYIRAKGRADGIIRTADLDWTIVQPSVIFGEGDEFVQFIKQVTTPVITGLPGADTAKFQPIWVQDFVSIIGTILEADEHIGETYEIGGPDIFTLREVTQLIYAAQNSSVKIIPIPIVLAKIGFAIAAPIPFIPFGPDQARSLQFDNTTTENALEEFGRDPTQLMSLGAYLSGDRDAPESRT